MFGNVHPLGFLAGEKAQDAETLIGQTELLVSSLAPLKADLQPATEALDVARSLFAAQEYSKAVAQAIRAGALAVSLNERCNAYMAAWGDLQHCREELQAVGFPTDTLEDALGAADKEVARRIEEDGATVPNYLGATALLERATAAARSLIGRARVTSREIFLASLAVEALSDSPSNRVSSPLTLRLEETVEHATRELALGHLAAASKLATEAKARAEAILAGAARVSATLDMAAAILDGLAAEGPMAEGLEEKIAAVREALEHGLLDRAFALTLAQQVSAGVASFAKLYPPSRKAVEQAKRAYGELQTEGYRSNEVEWTLGEGRSALGAGDWTVVGQSVARVSQTLFDVREERAKLVRSIHEISGRVETLRTCRLRMLPEVEEILGQAREHADGFRLSAAKELLLHADAVMMQATQAGS